MNADEQQWVVSLAHYPEPDMSDVDPAIAEKASALLDLWREHVPPSRHGGFGDFEDFFEQAARLKAALDTFGVANCWLYTNEGAARNLASDKELPKEYLIANGALDYGILHRWNHFHTHWQQGDEVGDRYISSRVFQERAGREMIVCGFAPDDPAGLDLRDALVSFSAAGHREALIKVARAKHGFWWVDVPADLTYEGADQLMWETMDMAPLNYEGRSESFLLQAGITMEYEYRFFVVNDEVVTGAGCVEEFTPLNNRGQFDDRMRQVRSEGGSVSTQPEILARYLPFAHEAAKAFDAEGVLHTYSLDLATGSDGAPLIIELNGLPNSGLYASDPSFVTRALQRAHA